MRALPQYTGVHLLARECAYAQVDLCAKASSVIHLTDAATFGSANRSSRHLSNRTGCILLYIYIYRAVPRKKIAGAIYALL